MKITAKQITTTAILLAICIVSQFFKNLSVYITGPIINACLILAVLSVGMVCAIILAVITPVTAFFISQSPIMAAIPAILPCVMIGTVLLVLGGGLFQMTFSLTQLITAVIGSVYAFIIWIPLKKVMADGSTK